MRAASLALLATLWFTTAPAFSRNGETGILIVVKRFETKFDAMNHRTFVICDDDWQEIQEGLNQGQEIRILLESLGVYEVVMNNHGDLRIRPVPENPVLEAPGKSEDLDDASFSLMPQECGFADLLPSLQNHC